MNDWDGHASWWQEYFTDGADSEYAHQIIPLLERRLPMSGLLLDIGAGEGQVARVAVKRGMQVVGLELSELQAVEGAARGSVSFVRSDAVALPIRSAVADAALCCLVIEHVPDLDGVFVEAARALRPGGRLLMVINHPLVQTPDSGWIDDFTLEPPESYWRVGDYLKETDTVEEVGRNTFVRFWFRPLHRYLNAARAAGLMLEEMLEPTPAREYLAEAHEERDARYIPRLMLLNFSRLS